MAFGPLMHTFCSQVWLETTAQTILAQRKHSSLSSGGSLSAVIDASLPQYQLAIERFQPSGNQQAQLWFDKVSFNQMLAWMHYIETEKGLMITSLSLNNEAEKGIVSARIRVKK